MMKPQSFNNKFALALDIGGTFIKTAIISSDGRILKDTFKKKKVGSQEEQKAIINNFAQVISDGFQKASTKRLDIIGIGIGIPGPFDFKNGISLMKHKLSGIYGVNLKKEIIKMVGLNERYIIRFAHDAEVFLIGECWKGASKNFNRVLGITLGTGIGVSFMKDGQIIHKDDSGAPLLTLWNVPYGDGIVEDRVSQRGIVSRYNELSGENTTVKITAKEIAERAIKGKDIFAIQVFKELGSILGKVLKPFLSELKVECIVFGGQISKSFLLFENTLKQELESIPHLKKISRASSIDFSPLYGAAKLIFSEINKYKR